MRLLSEHLKAAKDLLLQRGWCQGAFINGRGELCLEGALGMSSPASAEGIGSCSRAWQFLAGVIEAGDSLAFNPVVDFNDKPDRTPEEILDLLDRAILKAEAQEAEAAVPPAPELVQV